MSENEDTEMPEVVGTLLDHAEEVLVLLGVPEKKAKKLVEEFEGRIDEELPEPAESEESDEESADDEDG